MQLVDKDDGAALVLRELLEDGLQALLELAAVLGAGKERRHVESEHSLVLERFRHLAIDDALRKALHDRRLAHAGLADQNRVVLGAALQDLDHAADLVVASDHRIELARAGALGQVERVFFERLALAFGFGARHRFAAAQRLDRPLDRFPAPAVLFQQPARLALVFRQREEEKLRGDELVAPLLGFLVGKIEKTVQLARDLDLAAVAFDLGQPRYRLLRRLAQPRHVDCRTRKQGGGRAVFLLEQRDQQVQRLDELLVLPCGDALCIGERLLELGRQFVKTHLASIPGLQLTLEVG